MPASQRYPGTEWEWHLSISHMVHSPMVPYSQSSQGPGSGSCGIREPMKHGIVWAVQTQHLPGSWHLSSAALLLVNIWLAHPGDGWGLFVPHPNNHSSRKMSWRGLRIGKKNHTYIQPVPQSSADNYQHQFASSTPSEQL